MPEPYYKDDNFYFQLNADLREACKPSASPEFRKKVIEGWQNPVTTMLRALGKLPVINADGVIVYRGTPVPPAQVKPMYYEGRCVRWSGFTSTSLNSRVAVDIAGRTGTILRIKTFTGRDISPFSIFGEAENEVLLAPSQSYVVSKKAYLKSFPFKGGGYVDVAVIDFVETRGDELVT